MESLKLLGLLLHNLLLAIVVCAAMMSFPFVVVMVMIRMLEFAAYILWIGGSLVQRGG
jgi:hypothetical protein